MSQVRVITEEDDLDDENSDEHNQLLIDGFSDPKSPTSNSAFSFGKIKILKPHRRKRYLWFRLSLLSLFAICFSLLVVFVKRLLPQDFNLINFPKFEEEDCHKLVVNDVWNASFSMYTIESALRLVDVNNDSVLDIIVAFGTGMYSYSFIHCFDSYYF